MAATLREYFNDLAHDDTGTPAGISKFQSQSFTATAAYSLTEVKFYLKKNHAIGTLYCNIYAADGNHQPTGSSLGSTSIDGDTEIAATAAWISIPFYTPVALSASTEYCIVLSAPSAATDVAVGCRGSNSGDYYTGGQQDKSLDSGATWTGDTVIYDLLFETWGEEAGASETSAELIGYGLFGVTPSITFETTSEVSGSGSFDISPTVTNTEAQGRIRSLPTVPRHPDWDELHDGPEPRNYTVTASLLGMGPISGSASSGPRPAPAFVEVDGIIRNAAPEDMAWFEMMHLLPRAVQELGNVVSQQSFPVELHNADRTRDIQIVSVTNNLSSGIEITGVPATPFTINSQESLSATVVISTTGSLNIDSSYTFVDEDSNEYTFYITGSRIVLFPIRPEAPLRERLIFDTQILTSVSGKEQRIANRKIPRSVFEMTIKDNRRMMEMLLFDRQSKICATPAWHEPSFLTSNITTGDFTINVNTTDFANFYVGGYAIVYQDEYTYDALEITVITDTTITFSTEVSRDYSSTNSLVQVMPLMIAYFNHEIAASKNIYNEQTFNLRLTVDSVDNEIADASDWSTYDGKVFLDDPNMVQSGALQEVFERKVLVLDNTTGAYSELSQWTQTKRKSVKGFKTNNREELWKLRKLLHYLKGRQVSFYIPTFSKDIEPNTTMQETEFVLTMDNIGYTVNAQERAPKDYIRIHLKDGTLLTRGIDGSAELSKAEEQLTVDEAWPYDIEPDDIERIEFLEKVRLNVDEILITHYNALGQSTCFVATKEVFD